MRLDERGWWLTRADVLVAAGTLLVAGGVAATTWFGVGRPRSADVPAGAGGVSSDVAGAGGVGEGSAAGVNLASSSTDGPAAASSGGASATDGLDALVGYVDGASTTTSSPQDGRDTSAAGSASASAAGSAASSDVPGAGLFAVIQNTRGFYEALPLDVDATRIVRSDLGENEVEISGGAVRVSHSDCKNQVCVDAGWASWPGQVITCLPHQLVVQVVRNPSDAARLS